MAGRLDGDYVRDEDEQARHLREVFDAFDSATVDTDGSAAIRLCRRIFRAQRRNTTQRIALYMKTASQAPATSRATWYSTPSADRPLDTPRMNAR